MKNKIRETAGIFLINRDGNILIAHPTNKPKNIWSIPKGGLKKNETHLTAAIRETFEEVNFNCTDFKRIYFLDPILYDNEKTIFYPFIIFEFENPNLDWNTELKCNLNVPEDIGGFPEMDQFKWLDFDNANNLIHKTQKKCLKLIKEKYLELKKNETYENKEK